MNIFKILLKKTFTAINITLLIGSGFIYALFGVAKMIGAKELGVGS